MPSKQFGWTNPEDFRSCIDRVLAGDNAAAEELYEKCRRFVRVLAIGKLQRKILVRVDESDVAQETMRKIISDLNQFQGQTVGEFVGWLQKTLRNTVLNLARAHRAMKRDVDITIHESYSSAMGLADLCAAESSNCPQQYLLKSELLLRLAWAMGELQELNPRQHRAVELKHLQQMPIDAVAAELGKSPEAAAGLFRRGIESLRDLMK